MTATRGWQRCRGDGANPMGSRRSPRWLPLLPLASCLAQPSFKTPEKKQEHKMLPRASQRRPDVRARGGERLRARRREAVFEK